MRLAGIDIGTTACKGILLDERGSVLANATREYPLRTPHPGWTEQDPNDWVEAARYCLSQLGEHDALGFTGQMHGSVFLDSSDTVIRPALLWNDARTSREVAQIEERVGKSELMRITCNPVLAGFQAPKILWLRNNEPESFKRLKSVMLPKDYVRFAFTGVRETDVSDASGTSLFDVERRDWSHELLDALTLDRALFPDCKECIAACGAGDQAAGAIGTGAVTPGVFSVSLGTSGVVFSAQDSSRHDSQGRLHTFCHANGKWHSMSVMLSCGGALKWVRDTFGFHSYEQMQSLAMTAKSSQAVFKPYLAGERTPHNDPNLRGSFDGLSLSDGKAEIAQATFDGITDGLRDGFSLLKDLQDIAPNSIRVTGGGAKSDYWMQLIANKFGVATKRLAFDEGPAFGAAVLAGVNRKVWRTVEEACAGLVRSTDVFEPVAQ